MVNHYYDYYVKNLVESLGDSRKPRSSRDSRDARFTGILNDIKSVSKRERDGETRREGGIIDIL